MSLDTASDEELGEWFDGILEMARDRLPVATSSVKYGAASEQVIDFWGDPGSPALVVSIHGGYFAAPYDRTVNEPMCRQLANNGYYVANVEYRRAGSCADPNDTIADVRSAIRWIVENAATGRPTILVGHSAGGYLALKTSTEPGLTAVIAVSPITQLIASAAAGLDDGALSAWIGSDATESLQEWQSLELAPDLEPDLPVVLIHGSIDSVVPIEDSHSYVDLRKGRTETRIALTEIPGCGHYEFLDPDSSASATLFAQIAQLAL